MKPLVHIAETHRKRADLITIRTRLLWESQGQLGSSGLLMTDRAYVSYRLGERWNIDVTLEIKEDHDTTQSER